MREDGGFRKAEGQFVSRILEASEKERMGERERDECIFLRVILSSVSVPFVVLKKYKSGPGLL